MKAKRNLKYWIFFLDELALLASLCLAGYWYLYKSVAAVFTRSVWLEWLPILATAVIGWSILYFCTELDGFSGGWHFPTMLSQVALATAVLTLAMLAAAFLSHHPYSRVVFLCFAIIALTGFAGVRCTVAVVLQSQSFTGAMRRLVVLGNGHVAHELARKIRRHPELMCEVVGFLYPDASDAPAHGPLPPLEIGSTTSVPTVAVVEMLRAHKADGLLIAMPDGSPAELKKVVALCRQAGITITLVPQWYELYLSKAHLIDVDGLPMLSLVDHHPSKLDFAVKRAMDLVLGTILLVLVSPLLLVTAAALTLDNRKAFQLESRCGRGGRPFGMYRFNVDRDDPRLSGMQRFLAQFSLTELPQLWNVIRGDMAIVGPRPETPERVRHYSEWQRQRLNVTPGLTGLAQIHGLRDLHASEDKARFDLQYIHRWSPFLDLSVILQTCWTLAIRFWSPSSPAVTSSVRNAKVISTVHAGAPEVEYADRTHSCAN